MRRQRPRARAEAGASPDPRAFESLLDVLEDAALRYPGRRTFALRTEHGMEHPWTSAEMLDRSRRAAWRLRALGLRPGDRLLTWSPATPELPALYFGAMRAGVVLVPLDLRMAPDVVRRIADRSEAGWLAVGTGPDAPDPADAGLAHLGARTVSFFTDHPPHQSASGTDEGALDEPFPDDWQQRLEAWPRPGRDDLWEVIYTSGTTGHPKGVMLTHGTVLATLEALTRIIPPRPHRAVSLLPLSHLFEQAPVLLYGTMIGAEILYVRSRNPRLIFEALREHRVTTMVVVPQLLELFWMGLTREVARQGRERSFAWVRRIARFLPYRLRRLLFRRIHERLGGELRLFVVAGAYLPPELQRGWEDLGVVVVQGYGATECGPASATSERDHPTGTVGRTVDPVQLRLAEDGEILIGGPTVFPGYWRDPGATAAVLDPDGWYHTGDVGSFDGRGNLVLSGRTRNVIVLPNGLNVFPEDIENALQVAGLSQSVVIETAPGRIEAVVLPPGTPPVVTPNAAAPERPRTEAGRAALDREIDRIVRAANRSLAIHQRIAGWRLWPEPDFPRTHTLKIRRDAVRAWAAADTPLRIREAAGEVPGPPA